MNKMKNIFTLLILFIAITCNAQATKPNFDFETVKNDKPVGWKVFGNENYKTSVDSKISQKGKNSVVIEYNGDTPNFKAWGYRIPAIYQGKKIKLTGYLKTENVTNGFAGLWMRIDPSVAFDNMNNRGVTGTTNWKKYEIELDLTPSSAKKIVIGGLLTGKGKMWIDNLQLTIDGNTLEKTPPKELSTAEKDTEFNNGSNITVENLGEQEKSNLELLGRVWGFLKYHHPKVAKGNYNWDYELFRILPQYLTVKSHLQRDELLITWINSLGDIDICSTCPEIPSDAFSKPSFAWLDENNISTNLNKKLLFIFQNRHQGEHHYISMAPGVGNPKFLNESPYTDMPFPDKGYRLLSLYRYWNMIQYYFPYKHLMDKNWSTVLKEYIPKFINAKNELEYELVSLQLIGDIKDTHANIRGGNNAIQKWKGEFYAPIHVRFIENKLVVTDYYNPELKTEVNLQIGDVITKINDISIDNILIKKLPFYPASNYPTQLRDLSQDILRSNSKIIKISYIRNSKELTKTLKLYDKKNLNIFRWFPKYKEEKSYKLLEGNIGYVTLQTIKKTEVSEIKEAFKNTKGIIIDIRNYPSTFVPFSLGSYFISSPRQFVKFTSANLNTPGVFSFREGSTIPKSSKPYKGKLIVLVNELSQSQAEYTAMAFRAGDNTTIIGSTTAGADGNVSYILLPGGINTSITGIGVYYPDGTETQRVGIKPDVVIEPTINGVKNGKDEILEKAIEIISK